MSGAEVALHLERVSKSFPVGGLFSSRRFAAVDDVSFEVPGNTVVGLVGESGSGKSTLGRIAVGLIPATSGTVISAGANLAGLHGRAMRRHRRRMQMIFQDSSSSLNPRMSLEELLIEPMSVQGIDDRPARVTRARRIADEVGLSAREFDRLPHEFSGGQRQRISIARALMLEPEFIVADEPVSALDVSVQAQVLNLLKDIQRDRGLSMLFISHDLSVVQFMSETIVVLYQGKVVEEAPAAELYRNPRHDYTRKLLGSALRLPRHAQQEHST